MSNMAMSATPRSRVIPTTSRLVEVPMVVDMPPMIVARPIGSMNPDAGSCVRRAMPTRIGIMSTTIGVSLTNALMTNTATSMSNSAIFGRFDH
jgi:hypothetical protein